MDKLHIALVTTFPPGKGSLNEYAFHFVNSLKHKEEVGRLTLLVDPLPDGQLYPDVDGVEFVEAWSFNSTNNALRIRSVVQNLQPDCVLFNVQFATFGDKKAAAALGLVAPSMIKRLGIPTIVLLHNIMETVDLSNAGFGGNKIMETAIRKFGEVATRGLLQADYVALTIPKYVEILEDKYKADNVMLAPHGAFEDASEPPTFELPDGRRQIMTFGKFGTYKKVEILLDAVQLLEAEGYDDLQVVLAGSDSPNAKGYFDSVKEQYAHMDNVTYTGYVAEEDVPVLFREAAVVVFPYTSTTGSSGVLHQAGDYGKAVVLPKIGDFAEVITEEGYVGEFFEPQNPESLAAAMKKILDDDEHRIAMGSHNYLASRGIPIDNVVDWYLFHFQALLAEKI